VSWLGSFFSWFGGLLSSWRNWLRKKPSKHETKRYVVNDFHFPGNEPGAVNARNKKYADQKQKAKRNRKRKPKKAMKRLYQLGRSKAHPHRSRV
jgi:hypothetical protein